MSKRTVNTHTPKETKQDNKYERRFGLLDGQDYVPSTHTDITKTFRRFGWVPPTELKKT